MYIFMGGIELLVNPKFKIWVIGIALSFGGWGREVFIGYNHDVLLRCRSIPIFKSWMLSTFTPMRQRQSRWREEGRGSQPEVVIADFVEWGFLMRWWFHECGPGWVPSPFSSEVLASSLKEEASVLLTVMFWDKMLLTVCSQGSTLAARCSCIYIFFSCYWVTNRTPQTACLTNLCQTQSTFSTGSSAKLKWSPHLSPYHTHSHKCTHARMLTAPYPLQIL